MNIYFLKLLLGAPFQFLNLIFFQAYINNIGNLITQPSFVPLRDIVGRPLVRYRLLDEPGDNWSLTGLDLKRSYSVIRALTVLRLIFS
ncbi:MAG: hypothetical protein Q8N05_21190 [Bacteroidota bacterium]|nr:hypothetical protein [Bacteroidota bacterium]